MGNLVSAPLGPIVWDSPTMPNMQEDPTFDTNYGFEGERKERVMLASEEALISARLPLKLRDYCAHLLINYEACKRDRFPFVYRCKHERHEYEECLYESQILRMKEFERERRLMVRNEKLKKKADRHSSDDESS